MKMKLMLIFFLPIFLIGCQEENTNVIQTELPEYSPSDADIVVRGSVQNLNRFEEFLSKIDEETEDSIRIVTYTEEGDPILHDLTYDGNVILSTTDTRRDHFGIGSLASTSCKSITQVKRTSRTDYILEGCQNDHDKTVLVIHH